jgi:hypothetical protein
MLKPLRVRDRCESGAQCEHEQGPTGWFVSHGRRGSRKRGPASFDGWCNFMERCLVLHGDVFLGCWDLFVASGAPAPPTKTNELKSVHHAN